MLDNSPQTEARYKYFKTSVSAQLTSRQYIQINTSKQHIRTAHLGQHIQTNTTDSSFHSMLVT